MITDGLPDNSSDEHNGGLPSNGSQPSEPYAVESTSSTSTAPIGAKERNLMYLITGCSSLMLSNILAIGYFAYHCYSITNHLPTEGLMTDAFLGLILMPYGGSAVVWLQNLRKKP